MARSTGVSGRRRVWRFINFSDRPASGRPTAFRRALFSTPCARIRAAPASREVGAALTQLKSHVLFAKPASAFTGHALENFHVSWKQENALAICLNAYS